MASIRRLWGGKEAGLEADTHTMQTQQPSQSAHEGRLLALRELGSADGPLAGGEGPSGSQRTAEYWGQDARARLNELNAYRHWASHPVTACEINRQISGDPELGWLAYLKKQYFPQPGRRGLSLGCGSGAVVVDAVRLNVVDDMEGVDLSSEAVAVANERASLAGMSDKVRFRVENLDQATLQGEYDLVLFEQSLHHVDRLDALLDQCLGVLRPGGLFVINEYVGPDRFQWTDATERLMNQILGLLPERYRTDPVSGHVKSIMVRPTPEQVIAVDPSEAIHSADILRACSERFDLIERRDFGGTLLQFLLADIVASFDPDDARDVAQLRLLSMMETELIRSGAIESAFVFAVYRRPGDNSDLQERQSESASSSSEGVS